MYKLLLVEDCIEITLLVESALKDTGISVEICKSAQEAQTKAQMSQYDLILLDIMLPDGNGYDLFATFRASESNGRTPILFLSSLVDVPSKVTAYSLGAEDYIVKPFNFIEFRARIENKLRMREALKKQAEEYAVGPLVFELGTQRLRIRDSTDLVVLTPREFKILLYLARKPEWIFAREQILNEVLSGGTHVTERTVDTHICSLRRKLGRYGSLIESVPSLGYRFNVSADTSGAH